MNLQNLENVLKSSNRIILKKNNKTGRIFTRIKCGHDGCSFSAPSISSIKSHREEMNHPRKKIQKSPENINTFSMAKKFKQKAIKKILRKEAKNKEEYDTGALLPNGMPRKWRFCGFKDCDYRTQYKANLNRHQNHYGHRDIKVNDHLDVKIDNQLPANSNELPVELSSVKSCGDSTITSTKSSRLSDGSLNNKR